MSRRASVFARNNPGKRRVRFPDEVIFENEIKEQDGTAVMGMLRRASIDIDINRINSAGKRIRIFGPRRDFRCRGVLDVFGVSFRVRICDMREITRDSTLTQLVQYRRAMFGSIIFSDLARVSSRHSRHHEPCKKQR